MYLTNDYSPGFLAFQPMFFPEQSDLCEAQPETEANTSTPTPEQKWFLRAYAVPDI